MTRLTDRLLAELTREAAATRRVFESVPDDRLAWRPHARSMSLGQLALHVARVPGAVAELLDEPEHEIPTVPRPEATSRAELLRALDGSVAAATEKLTAWGDEYLDQNWSMTRHGTTVLSMPRYDAVRAIMLNHWYHHRGQLTVYLRLLDVPVPGVYGPSADEERESAGGAGDADE